MKSASAMASMLAIVALTTPGRARNWLAPLPDTEPTVTADVLKFKDTSINYGPRARVRIYRPDGVYDIDNAEPEAPAAVENLGDGKPHSR